MTAHAGQAANKPIEYFIYRDAEHGMTRFQQKENGERVTLGFEGGYLRQQLEWFRKQTACCNANAVELE